MRWRIFKQKFQAKYLPKQKKIFSWDVYKRQIVILAVGDAAGRILTGALSNRFGRRNVLSAAFLLQMLLMFGAFFLSQSGSAVWIVLAATFIGMSYGANLVLFPNYVKDFWGMRHFGAIYGMLFTAWGVGGFVMIKVAENLTVNSGSSFQSFMVAGCLMLVAFMLTFRVDNRKDIERAAMRRAKTQNLVRQKNLSEITPVAWIDDKKIDQNFY